MTANGKEAKRLIEDVREALAYLELGESDLAAYVLVTACRRMGLEIDFDWSGVNATEADVAVRYVEHIEDE
jgi:hypothetical protein